MVAAPFQGIAMRSGLIVAFGLLTLAGVLLGGADPGATTAPWHVAVPARGSARLTYRVRVKY